MHTFPATYVIYLTTEGFGGCSTIYQATLDHMERQVPLTMFQNRLASIKITPGREWVAEKMIDHLKSRGFEVITAVAPWERGLSHYAEYLKDMIRVSQHELVYRTPFIFTTDHDYPIICHKDPLEKVIGRMIDLVGSSPDILSSRFLREQDSKDPVIAEDRERDIFWSQDWNLQPMVMRSRDYHYACKIIEDNWSAATKMHGEALWRDVLSSMSRSDKKHAVWLPEYAQVVNLGAPDYLSVAKRLDVVIEPNPKN